MLLAALAGCTTTTTTTPTVSVAPPVVATPAPVPVEPPQTSEPTPTSNLTTDPGPPATPSGNNDFPDAGLPDEAIVFPDAQWNDMGYFNARAIAYVESSMDPERLPDDWPAESKFFGLFFQVECTEMIKENTDVDVSGFEFAGPRVQRVSGNVDPGGDVRSYWKADEVGDIGYVCALLTAEKLEDITQGWYKYSVKNEQTDDYDYYMHYITSMPFGGLVVRDRPADFDYVIPPSAVVSIGDWSEPATDPAVRVRTLAYDEYPMRDRDKPDFLFPEEKIFYIYFEAENTGSETYNFASIFTSFTGTGVKDHVTLWGGLSNTIYSYTIANFEPGAKGVYYEVIAAKSVSDVQSITITLDGIEVPFEFWSPRFTS